MRGVEIHHGWSSREGCGVVFAAVSWTCPPQVGEDPGPQGMHSGIWYPASTQLHWSEGDNCQEQPGEAG